MKLGAVLLASGAGRRFGGNKLLTPVAGSPLITRVMDALPPALFARAAVCSPYEKVLALAGQRGYLPLLNGDAAEGVSASIRLGLSHMAEMDGVLFSVCDQPYMNPDSIKRLLDSFLQSPDRIHALAFQGARGNPAVFPRALFPALTSLTGDTGGGAVIRAHPRLITLVEVASPRELRDVDTPDDLI